MSAVIASHIPITATEAKITEFFSFCGRIISISTVEKTEKTKTIEVIFEKSSAVSTALLLNGAEFEGSQIEVIEAESTGGNNEEAHEPSGNVLNGDIDQEFKPKSAIIAELLANGYVLQSSLVQKAVEFDQQRGISDKFRNFISNLDNTYHLQEKNQKIYDETNNRLGNMYDQANSQWGIENHWNEGLRTLNSYLDKFKKDKYGGQVHDFYTNVAKDVKSVNEEALRLAEMKKRQAAEGNLANEPNQGSSLPQTDSTSLPFPAINSITPDSTSAATVGTVAFEADKKR